MSNRMYGALIASLGAVALICAADETFAAAPRGMTSMHPHFHSHFHSPFARHHFRHNHRNNDLGVFWPDEGFYNEPPGGAGADFTQPIPNDIRNTNAYDIPWDWAHRYPPLVAPSEKPYVSSCPTETVKVSGKYGQEETINITRCY